MDVNTQKLAKYISVEVGIFIAFIVLLIYRSLYEEVLRQFAPFIIDLFNLIPTLIAIMFVLLTTHFVLLIMKPPFTAGLNHVMRSEADVKMMWQLLSYTIWFIIILLLIFLFIPDISTALIGATVIIAALLYALQRVVLNIGGWFAIVFRQPYKIGDRICVNEVSGYVIEITVFYTVVREFKGWMAGDSFTGRHVSIPNSFLFEYTIHNYTKDTPFIWDEVMVSITFESDHDKAKLIMLESAMTVLGDNMEKYHEYMTRKMEFKELQKEIRKEPEVLVKLAESSVETAVVYYCYASERRVMHSKITEKILKRIAAEKSVHIAYPHIQWVPHTESKKM